MSNVFSFTGRVGRDAEVRYTPSQQAVLNVAVAHDVGYGDKKQTIWVDCAVWGKKAESTLVNYLKKGQQVFVSGELSQSTYKANDGTDKTKWVMSNVHILDLVGSKKDGDQSGQSGQSGQSAPQSQHHAHTPSAKPPVDNFDAPYDDDIPF